MSNKRGPLSNNTNAVNSPLRAVAAAAKRPRTQTNAATENDYEQPPVKKQIIELKDSGPRTPTRATGRDVEGRALNKKAIAPRAAVIDRRILAAKVDPAESRAAKAEKAQEESLASVKRWKEHYLGVFPAYVFYFESVPDNIRLKYSREISLLGAREEKFFSKDITHIVTSRAIPTDSGSGGSERTVPSSTSAKSQEQPQVRTINPSLLEKSAERAAPKGKFSFEAPVARQTKPLAFQDIDPRKEKNKQVDVLIRAKELGIKIWQVDKFDRIITLLNGEEDERPSRHEHNTRGKPSAVAAPRAEKKNDLSHLLKDEKLNGPVDREPTSELVMFKGPYIYIHDIHEKYKPIMVREYPKVENREDGAWPHFRSVSAGKCPFVEDVSTDRRERERLEKEQRREEERLAQIKLIKARPADAPRTRAAAAVETISMQPPQSTRQARPLLNVPQRANIGFQRPQHLPANGSRAQDVLGKAPIPAKGLKHFPAGDGPGFYGGEPTASGLQQSNVTSAIRSQVISSTAAVPGAKSGLSKEVHELKRKVLERNTGPSLNEMIKKNISSRDQVGNRTNVETHRSVQRVQEKRGPRRLGNIEEEETSDGEEEPRQQTASVKERFVKATKLECKDAKPGYCENCRDKFDDFDEHIVSRKHRRFALDDNNWAELDDLFTELDRPLRSEPYTSRAPASPWKPYR